MNVAQIGRHCVVRGLSWRAFFRGTPAELKEDAVKALKLADTEHGCRIDAGEDALLLGILPPGAPSLAKKAVSAAAWLADTSGTTKLVYIEQLDDTHYWIAGVIDGLVDTRLDRIGDARVVSEALETVLPSSRRSKAIAQDTEPYRIVTHWQDPIDSPWLKDAECADFLDLTHAIAPARASRIRKLRGIQPRVVISVSALALLGVALALGQFAYRLYSIHRDQEVERTRLMAAADHAQHTASIRELRIAAAVRAALATDLSTAAPNAWMDACLETLKSQRLWRGAWQLRTFRCEPEHTEVTYARDSGSPATIASLDASYPNPRPHDVSLAQGMVTTRTTSAGTEPRTPPSHPQALPEWSDFLHALPSALQRLETTGGLSWQIEDPTPRPIAFLDPDKELQPHLSADERQSAVPTAYRLGRWEAKARERWILEALPIDVANVSATSLTAEGTTPDALTWTLKGTYAVR